MRSAPLFQRILCSSYNRVGFVPSAVHRAQPISSSSNTCSQLSSAFSWSLSSHFSTSSFFLKENKSSKKSLNEEKDEEDEDLDEIEELEQKMETEVKKKPRPQFLREMEDDDEDEEEDTSILIHPKPTLTKASSIDDVEFDTKNSRPVSEDRTPGKYEQIKSMISGYKTAPRAILQKELQKNGISPEYAKKYCDLLEERGLDTHEKVNLFLRRMRPRFPKLS